MNDKSRQQTVQARTTVTRGKIVEGAIHVLAHAGVSGVTHRAVAKAAGVSLAATTYHFDTKSDIIKETSRVLLDGYLAAFRRLAHRIETGEETQLKSLDDLVRQVVLNALGREQTRSLAWCELILHDGRDASDPSAARHWYRQLDAIWHDIARLFDPEASRQRASAAIDLAIGLTFLLHPLGLHQTAARHLLEGRAGLETYLAGIARDDGDASSDKPDGEASKRYDEKRQKIVQAAIDILIDEGVSGITYRRIAEVSGMVRSGPSYYFASIEDLLSTAQVALFERAKARYRSGLDAAEAADMDTDRLIDLTTAIFFREALEFGRENIGYYSAWLSAAHSTALRATVAASLLDIHLAWARRFETIPGTTPNPLAAMRMQALFIGKLVRAIASSLDISDLSLARRDFADELKSCPHSLAGQSGKSTDAA